MHTTSPSASVAFDADRFDALCRECGWDTDAQRARGLGVNQSTISRIRRGLQRPGLGFAVRCRTAFGDTAFDELFGGQS